MKRRAYALACALATAGAALPCETAQAADPTTSDCLAASDASLKLGNEHKLRAERAQLLVCAASTCPADIRKDCASRVDEVNSQIPTIIFAAKDPSGGDISAVKISMDGDVVTERLEGTAISIDPGEHTFTFEMAGQPPLTKKLIIQEAQKERRELITFGTPGAAEPATGSPAGSPAGTPPPVPADSGGLGTQKILAIVAGGVGVVGLGLGTIFGLQAMSKKDDAQKACPNKCATADGVDKWNDAASAGTVSTVGFIIGAVGLAGGAVLWFTAPSADASKTQVGVGPGGFQLKGSW